MSLLGVKLRRDLRASWSRCTLMVVAIAVSLTVLGGVLCAWAAIGRETERAYLGTEPASATILLDRPVDADRLAAIAAELRDRPGVLAAAARTQFGTAVEVDGRDRDVAMQVYVAAPDDPMRIARAQVRQGSWPPAADELLVRDDSLALLGAAPGDTVTVTTPAGERVRLRIAGTVYDPSLSPSPQEQRANGYASTTAVGARLDQLKLQVAEPGQSTPARDRAAVVATAEDVGAWLRRAHDLSIREVQVPEPYAHPHQWQADALLLSLLAGAAAALLLSTVLVATMLNNLLTQQIPQIGIMKAIGGSTGRIGRLYLTMTVLVAAAATLVAVGPAILLGRFGVARFTGFLGIEPTELAAPWWCVPAVVAVGLMLPPLMAVRPLLRASRTTVRAAIDHRGGATNPGAATRLLSRLHRLDRGLLMALRNTVRRPARFALSVGLLAAAGAVFVAGMSLSAGTSAIAEEQTAQRTWDVDVQLGTPAPAAVTAAVARVPGVRAVEGWQRVPVGVAGPGRIPVTRTYPDQGHGGTALNAIPADTSAPPPEVSDGRWLTPGETGAVVLSQSTRDTTVPGVRPGDSVQLVIAGRPTTWRVVGIVTERGGGAVYTTSAGLAAATGAPPKVNQLRVTSTDHDEPSRTALAATIADTLTAAGADVTASASVSRGTAASEGHLGPVILILLGVAVPLGVIGAIGLATTMSANVLDRTREIGVLHAIGARPRAVRRIIVAEGLIIAVASCLVAILPALALTAALGAGLGNLFFSAPLPFRISPLAVALWLALTTLGAILATDTAATRASRLTIREAVSNP